MTKPEDATPKEITIVGPPLGLAGWITDYARLGGAHAPRRVSVLRGSHTLTDFRLEFSGQIENKALGWVLRAKDPKNFYVMKLEMTKSTGILSRFAVINGRDQARVQAPLSIPLRPNQAYAIRVDALGSSFTTWVDGQQVDRWADPQIPEGSVGIYSEHGERGTIVGNMAVFTLHTKSQAGS